jgi:hypothetical protein
MKRRRQHPDICKGANVWAPGGLRKTSRPHLCIVHWFRGKWVIPLGSLILFMTVVEEYVSRLDAGALKNLPQQFSLRTCVLSLNFSTAFGAINLYLDVAHGHYPFLVIVIASL